MNLDLLSDVSVLLGTIHYELGLATFLNSDLFCMKTSKTRSFQTAKCNGAQRLMSHLCLMASSCVHAVTSYLMCAALYIQRGFDLLDATLKPNIN